MQDKMDQQQLLLEPRPLEIVLCDPRRSRSRLLLLKAVLGKTHLLLVQLVAVTAIANSIRSAEFTKTLVSEDLEQWKRE